MENSNDLSYLADNWPSKIVARSQIKVFTGGMLTPDYMRQLDYKGEGPKGKIKIGRKVGYKVDDLIEWLENRMEKELS